MGILSQIKGIVQQATPNVTNPSVPMKNSMFEAVTAAVTATEQMSSEYLREHPKCPKGFRVGGIFGFAGYDKTRKEHNIVIYHGAKGRHRRYFVTVDGTHLAIHGDSLLGRADAFAAMEPFTYAAPHAKPQTQPLPQKGPALFDLSLPFGQNVSVLQQVGSVNGVATGLPGELRRKEAPKAEAPVTYADVPLPDTMDPGSFPYRWGQPLTNDERDGLVEYAIMGYREMNGHLRSGTPLKRYAREFPLALQGVQKGEIVQAVTVYRGFVHRTLTKMWKEGTLEPGLKFTNNGFLSTTLSRKVAKQFSQEYGNGFIAVIQVPAGQRCAYLEGIEDPDDDDIEAAGEYELLLPPGIVIRLTGSKQEGSDKVLCFDVVPK